MYILYTVFVYVYPDGIAYTDADALDRWGCTERKEKALGEDWLSIFLRCLLRIVGTVRKRCVALRCGHANWLFPISILSVLQPSLRDPVV